MKATPAKDKKGRKGYFITNTEIRKKARIVVVKQTTKSRSKKAASAISPDVLELLDEMNAHIRGKIKPRPLDEFLRAV